MNMREYVKSKLDDPKYQGIEMSSLTPITVTLELGDWQNIKALLELTRRDAVSDMMGASTLAEMFNYAHVKSDIEIVINTIGNAVADTYDASLCVCGCGEIDPSRIAPS